MKTANFVYNLVGYQQSYATANLTLGCASTACLKSKKEKSVLNAKQWFCAPLSRGTECKTQHPRIDPIFPPFFP